MNKITIFWMIVIFFCAATFRLTALDLIEFKTDQANIVLKMEQFYTVPFVFVIGPKTSFLAQNFPLNYYILAVVSALSRDPMVFSGMIGLVNALACMIFYLITKKYYGNFTAVISGLLLAFSPWSILYSRQIWTPDLITPLILPLYYFLHKLILEKNPKAILGVMASSLIIFEWHPTGMLLSVIIFLIIIILRVKINFKYLIFGLIIGLIPTIPYLVHEITRNCPDCSAYVSYLQKTNEERKFSPEVFFQPLQMINGLSVTQFLGEDIENFYQSQPYLKVLNIIFVVSSLILFASTIFIRKNKQYLFLSLIVLFYPILDFISKSPPYDYYQLIIILPVIILYSLSVSVFYNRSKVLGITIIAVILISNTLYVISYGSFLNQKQFINGAYGPIYRWTLKTVAPKLDAVKSSAHFNLDKYQILFNYFNDLNPQYSNVYQDNY